MSLMRTLFSLNINKKIMEHKNKIYTLKHTQFRGEILMHAKNACEAIDKFLEIYKYDNKVDKSGILSAIEKN